MGRIRVRRARLAARRAAAVVALAACAGAAAQTAPGAGRAAQRLEREGVVIELRLDPAGGGDVLREGTDADLRLSLHDSAGTPVSGLRPAVWIDARASGPAAGPAVQCSEKVRAFLQGSLAARPSVDVNTYYLLTLNREPNLSVLDPLVDFGGSRLLTLVALDAPGEDWALSADARRLYVSLPALDRVAVVETASWKSVARVDAGPRPRQVLLQSRPETLWVANDPEGAAAAEGGVSALDPQAAKPRGRVRTGAGPHALAFGRDERVVYVANRAAGTVSIVDTESLAKLRDVKVGPAPVSVAWSALSGAAYVADETDGSVTVLDGQTHDVRARLTLAPGIVEVRFSPDGRWGFVPNPREDVVDVIDSSSDRVVHRLPVAGGPDRVSFSLSSAYFHARRSENVALVALQALGGSLTPGVFAFPGGQTPPEQGGTPAVAGLVAPTPEGDAVLVANPADKVVYYYKEGMAVPMGHYQNYRRVPRAVMVVDRSLRERTRGVYTARVQLPPAGAYDVALLLEAPRVVHCFDLEVAPRDAAARRATPRLRAELLPESELVAGRAARVRFRLLDALSGAPRGDLTDVRVLAVQPPGIWQERGPVRAVAGREAEGVYEAELTFPESAVFYFYFECPSLGLGFNQAPFLVASVADRAPGSTPDAGKEQP